MSFLEGVSVRSDGSAGTETELSGRFAVQPDVQYGVLTVAAVSAWHSGTDLKLVLEFSRETASGTFEGSWTTGHALGRVSGPFLPRR